jgi:hypothetical protein
MWTILFLITLLLISHISSFSVKKLVPSDISNRLRLSAISFTGDKLLHDAIERTCIDPRQ